MIIRFATTLAQALLELIDDGIDGGGSAGVIKFYDGTQPTAGGDAITTQTLLGTVTFSLPSKGSITGNKMTFDAITKDTGSTGGTVSWARIEDSAASTQFDCDVTATGGGGAIQLNSVSVGAEIDITSFTIELP